MTGALPLPASACAAGHFAVPVPPPGSHSDRSVGIRGWWRTGRRGMMVPERVRSHLHLPTAPGARADDLGSRGRREHLSGRGTQ